MVRSLDWHGLAMDRRDFLKRTIAVLLLAALSVENNDFEAILRRAKGEIKPNRSVKGLPAGKVVFGGNLFTAYARGRFSVDDAEVRV
ncbi:MAG: hypothetical protein JW749_12510 [Sedimentisphaerales bacterium]|nr:hypothetical protein [Sedimentisphaerales bacterium]